MTNKKLLTVLAIFLCGIAFYSCSDDLELETETNLEFEQPKQSDIEVGESEEFVTLGKRNEIPFTLENMQKALELHQANPTTTRLSNGGDYQVASVKTDYSSYKITHTHNYYKFTPTDSIHIDILQQDTILNVSDIPFEYDVETNGVKYVDPDFPQDGSFTYYYSVAPVDYKLPAGIPVEIIAKMHFTNEDEIPDNPTPEQETYLKFIEELNEISLFMSGYMDEEDINELDFIDQNQNSISLSYPAYENQNYSTDNTMIDFSGYYYVMGRKWRPSGRVTVEEGVLTRNTGKPFIIGVKGAEIKVRKWGFLVIRKAVTNEDGYFSTRRTRTKRVKYACYFNHRPDFYIKAGTYFWAAKHRSHRRYKRGAWYQHFPETIGRSHFYALIQNASYDYYRKIPFQYGIWRPSQWTNINAEYKPCKSSQTRPRIIPFHCQIRITRKDGKCTYRQSDGIYATTVHELTHQAHIREDVGLFHKRFIGGRLELIGGIHIPYPKQDNEAALMCESWAEGVETIVTNDRYRSLYPGYRSYLTGHSSSYPLWNHNRQDQTVPEMNEYTPIVDDLIDNLNQNTVSQFFGVQPIDRVSGYNLSQLQQSIYRSRDINRWRDNIRYQHNNPTENFLNELFEYPNEVADNL